ncbi:Undecaprenyl phosphate-alpha-4-amino-4-deoxy-L-arabinose arabinosyl transferase [bacterium HR36]|nr:Undecaprenyl phosphate-alpha-4-amino-4-deoxy-L-arabinose arabinosyl transferase [bacterium HR36]
MSPLSTLIRAATAAPSSLTSLTKPVHTPELCWRWRIHLAAVAVLVLSIIVCFLGLGQRDLWSSHEARAAQDAVAVLEGEWLIPRLYDGRQELQKPPLYYWLVVLTSRFLDRPVDAFTVRLPAALSAVAIALTLLTIGYLAGKPMAGIFAVGALMLMPHFVWLAHVGRVDLPLTASFSIALAAWWIATRNCYERWLRYPALTVLSLSLAAGLLLKGPIALVLFVLVTGSDLVAEMLAKYRGKSRCFSFRIRSPIFPEPAAIMLILLSVAPALAWYIAANEATAGQWVREFIYRHNLARGLGGDSQLDRHAHWLGPAFYLVQLPLLMGPIVFLIPWLGYLQAREFRADNLLRLSLSWCLMPLLFLSLMRYKRVDYLLPAYPGLALFVGGGLAKYLESVAAKYRRRCYIVSAVSLTAGATIWAAYVTWGIPLLDAVRQQRTFARLVREYVPDGPVMMYGTEAHLLSYHVGKPIARTFKAEEIWQWLARKGAGKYVVATARGYHQLAQASQDYYDWQVVATSSRPELSRRLKWLRLEQEEPLVLLRALPRRVSGNSRDQN